MEYVILKGKGDILYTADTKEITLVGNSSVVLPSDPCDLELFRDTLHEALTEIINKKRGNK